MRRLLLSLLGSLVLLLSAHAQDSLHYSVLWTPTYAYQKAGVKQEGVFLHQYKNGVIQDSALLQVKVYDSLGRVLRSEDYRRSKLRTRYTYFYSGSQLDSMLQEEIWLRAKIVHRYSYDRNSNLILKQTFRGNRKMVQERYVYNNFHQPLQVYRQIGNSPEIKINEYKYRNDRLIQQIDHWFEGNDAKDNFFYLYTYSKNNRISTRSFQRKPEEKRFIDCIKTYNERDQLIEKIDPPFPKLAWIPPDIHPRPEEIVETYFYHSNGMLAEVQTKINDQLVAVRKHIYFY